MIIEYITIAIAVFAVIFSIHSWKKSYKTLHRPYVWVGNSTVFDGSNRMIPQPHESLMKIYKSPAKILKEQYSFFIEGENRKETIHEEIIYEDIKYPTVFGDIQYGYTAPAIMRYFDDINIKLYRYIRVDYKWISSDEKTEYYFEGKWAYNPEKHNWDVVSINAN